MPLAKNERTALVVVDGVQTSNWRMVKRPSPPCDALIEVLTESVGKATSSKPAPAVAATAPLNPDCDEHALPPEPVEEAAVEVAAVLAPVGVAELVPCSPVTVTVDAHPVSTSTSTSAKPA